MKGLGLTLRYLRHNPFRTAAIVCAIALSSFLLCSLTTVVEAVDSSLAISSSSRLVTQSARGLTSSLPTVYRDRIAAVPGVTGVSIATLFVGFLDSPPRWSSYFPNLAVDENYLSLHPEIELSQEEREAFRSDRRGCIVGLETAQRFGWKVGDTVYLESAIPPYRRPAGPFELVVRGVYTAADDGASRVDETRLLFHFRYLEEGLPEQPRTKTFVVTLDDPERAGEIGSAIDALFESSQRPTRTDTEAAFNATFASAAGQLTTLLEIVGAASAFAMLLVTLNAMAMGLRARRPHFAVLKAIGFSFGWLLRLALGEGLLLGLTGGLLGIVLAAFGLASLPGVPVIGPALAQLPGLELSRSVVAIALSASTLLGATSGALPAIPTSRTPTLLTLRAVG